MSLGDFKSLGCRYSLRLVMTFTLDIDPKLWAKAETTATSGGTTMRELVEEGLRRVLDERAHAENHSMEDFATGGHGLDGSFQHGGWATIRDSIYGNED